MNNYGIFCNSLKGSKAQVKYRVISYHSHGYFLSARYSFSAFAQADATTTVSYKSDTEQTVNLVLNTNRIPIKKEKKIPAELQLHSDQSALHSTQAHLSCHNNTAVALLTHPTPFEASYYPTKGHFVVFI